MFVQVIEGRVRDQEALRAHTDRWVQELAPGATGWLGLTAGVAEDGTSVAVVRFQSEEAARANSDRPEQGAWWAEAEKLFDGEVTFRESATVDLYGSDDRDGAGFVQVIQGRADRDKVLAEMEAMEEFLARVRPDVIGGTMAWHDDGSFTEAVYFTSEAEARKNEKAELTPEDTARFAELVELLEMQRFVDLRQAWLYSR